MRELLSIIIKPKAENKQPFIERAGRLIEYNPYVVVDPTGWPWLFDKPVTKPVTLVGKLRSMLNPIRRKQ